MSLLGQTSFVKKGFKSAGEWAMNNPEYIGVASSIGDAAITSNNNENNTKWGTYGDDTEMMKEGVFSNLGPIGAIASAANKVGGLIGSALNKGNAYNEYGYNEKDGRGLNYMQAGGLFDPFSMGVRALKEGGEGSGLRAIAGFTGLGGAAQFKYEQEQALERERLANKEEDDLWKLNQFNYTPNLDV